MDSGLLAFSTEANTMTTGREFGCFCFGCAIGAAVAVLFAPKSGAETVDYLRKTANEGADYAKRTIDEAQSSVNKVAERAKKAIHDQAEGVSAAVQAGKQAYRNATT